MSESQGSNLSLNRKRKRKEENMLLNMTYEGEEIENDSNNPKPSKKKTRVKEEEEFDNYDESDELDELGEFEITDEKKSNGNSSLKKTKKLFKYNEYHEISSSSLSSLTAREWLLTQPLVKLQKVWIEVTRPYFLSFAYDKIDYKALNRRFLKIFAYVNSEETIINLDDRMTSELWETFQNHCQSLYPYVCRVCKKSYTARRVLNAHIINIHKKKRHWCLLCSKSYAHQSGLRVHTEAVHSKKKYACSPCNKSYTSIRGLYLHIKSVHNKIIYECPTCYKKYTNRVGVQEHIRVVHEGIRSSCSICGEELVCDRNLQAHIKVVHKRDYDFYCADQACVIENRLFSTKVNLNMHIQRMHEGKINRYIKKEEKRILSLLNREKIVYDHNLPIKFCLVDTGKNRAFLDIAIKMEKVLFILEIDEDQHGLGNMEEESKQISKKNCDYDYDFGRYNVKCEQTRMLNIQTALMIQGETLPIVFIRFNPHNFKINGQTVHTKTEIHQGDYRQARETTLILFLRNYQPQLEFEIHYFYYDTLVKNGLVRCCIQDHHEYSEILSRDHVFTHI